MKPIVGPLFDREWRKACSVKACSVKDVDEFIKAHYLAKRPAIVLLAMVMLHESRPVGCVVYSAPPRECDKRYGGKTWELARLYLLDEVPQNAETWLIAQSVKWIKRNRPEVCNLVSYADPSAGHSGTIYKAANWREDGRTDDERKTPRCDYYDARTGKKYGRRGNMPADAVVERRPRVSKYRFALAIRRPNAPDQARLQPSPEAGCSVDELTDGIQQAISMLMDHIDKYHDCDIPENTEAPPEQKALQNIMYHLMGTITANARLDRQEEA